jgi:hypothetical protein
MIIFGKDKTRHASGFCCGNTLTVRTRNLTKTLAGQADCLLKNLSDATQKKIESIGVEMDGYPFDGALPAWIRAIC